MRPERFRTLETVLDRRQPDLTVLMERVNNRHNLAAILRSCDAVGILETHCVLPGRAVEPDPQTSAGSYKWVPVRRHVSAQAAATFLRAQGMRLLAADPAPGALDYRDVDYTRPTAIMVGAELDGISKEGLALADQTISIPMTGMVRSLNVSVATALVLFEAFRQRQEAGLYDHRRIDGEVRGRLLFRWAYPRLAARLDETGHAYPELDAAGRMVGAIPGSIGRPLRPADPVGTEEIPRDQDSRM